MILPLESQVCSLKSAKRLKELGCRQESLFYWGQRRNPIVAWRENPSDEYYKPDLFMNISESGLKIVASAYTVAELGEMLPRTIQNKLSVLVIGHLSEWHISYRGEEFKYTIMNDMNEAESRSLMLIYLLENKLMEVKK